MARSTAPTIAPPPRHNSRPVAAVLRAPPSAAGVAVASGRARGARRVGVPTGGVSVTRVGSNVGGSLGRVAVAETISVGVTVGVSPPSLGNGVAVGGVVPPGGGVGVMTAVGDAVTPGVTARVGVFVAGIAGVVGMAVGGVVGMLVGGVVGVLVGGVVGVLVAAAVVGVFVTACVGMRVAVMLGLGVGVAVNSEVGVRVAVGVLVASAGTVGVTVGVPWK